VTPPSAWLQQRIDAFAALEERLRAAGYAARVTTEACPVQLGGRLPTGEAFYLHCGEDACELSLGFCRPSATVAPPSDEIDAVIDRPAWRDRIARWGPYEASWLDAEEVEAVFRELLARYTQPPLPLEVE
jgi:hypothetical protein